jgi:hypothetical protein
MIGHRAAVALAAAKGARGRFGQSQALEDPKNAVASIKALAAQHALGHDIGFGIGIAHGFARSGPSASRAGSTMPPSARCPTWPNIGSRVNREVHARFWERADAGSVAQV